MFNKTKELWMNFKTKLLYFLIRFYIKKENRKLFLKWIEMKEDLISEYDFNMWVTKNILNEDQEEETDDFEL